MMAVFAGFPKIPRLSRIMTITEKIDGTNAQIYIDENEFLVGSRTRWITPDNDNHGFARWAYEHKPELLALGNGHHYGEWWGQGIQRKYNQQTKHFSLFNTAMWLEDFDNTKPKCPTCCQVVPVLYRGLFDTEVINLTMARLQDYGSYASQGFMNPEGIVIYHESARMLFKKTFEHDIAGKGEV
jgi:hypothetical protein